jgi:uncharacterized protein YbaR (Trm112 family)
MSNKINICLVDKSNKKIDQMNIVRPKTYEELLNQIKKGLKVSPDEYTIFYKNKNAEVIINGNNEYNKSNDILFIRKNETIMGFSLLDDSDYKLTESTKSQLEEEFNCNICKEFIKIEKPYFCHICQKIFHHKCLEDWGKKRNSFNEILNCPYCRNELPLEQWKEKMDYEELIKQIIALKEDNFKQTQLIHSLKSTIRKLKNNSEINKNKEELDEYLQNSFLLIKDIIYKINEISSYIQQKSNDNLINILPLLSTDYVKTSLDNISSLILGELENIQKYVKNSQKKSGDIAERIHEYRKELNIKYFTTEEGKQNIFGTEFVRKNRNSIELIIDGKKNVLVDSMQLKKGDNAITILIKNKLTNLSHMFNGCSTLKNISELSYLDTRDVTDFSFMFWGCSSLNDIKPIENWNVTKGKNFQSMFGGCSSLEDIRPLQYWNVSNGNNFSAMFYFCSLLLNIKPLQKWNMSNSTNVSGMFSKCKSLSDLKPIEKWDVSKCNNFSAMFFECESLSDLSPLQRWNVSKGNVFARMFCDTKTLSNAELLHAWKLSKENFNSMFV